MSQNFSYEVFTQRNIGFVTPEEQEQLRNTCLLVIGVGGMGGVAVQCLIRAGIGKLIIADIDHFEISNLNRQIFSSLENIGASKAEVTGKALKNINPECEVQVLGAEWIDQLDELMKKSDLVINGCDDVKATLKIMRRAKVLGKTVIDAFASPLPSAYVVRPEDPRPEATFGYPSVNKDLEALSPEEIKECSLREIEYVMTHSSSIKHVHFKFAKEMVTGQRKRISFAPMVWATGVLMAYEAVRVLLNKPGGPGYRGAFLNPWDQRYERAKINPISLMKRFFVKRFFKSLVGVLAVVIVAGTFTSCLDGTSESLDNYQSAHPDQKDLPAAHFMMSDFGGINSDTLQTNAIPWKVAMTFMLKDQNEPLATPTAISKLMSKFGFITPTSIGNWPATAPQPEITGPVGLIKGIGKIGPEYSLELANINCSACHAGRGYDSKGNPTNQVWLGLPNTSINTEMYVQSVFNGLIKSIQNKDETLKAVKAMFPETPSSELRAIDAFFPTIKKKVEELQKNVGKATPFSNGSPGVTNGVASLKKMLSVIKSDRYHSDETAFTAVPDLSNRGLRSSLLYDGVYSLLGEDPFAERDLDDSTADHMRDLGKIVGFFNTPVQGQPAKLAEKNLPKAMKAIEFLTSYRAPRFPGVVDLSMAADGQKIFENRCTACHGTFSGDLKNQQLTHYPNRLLKADVIGTDPYRANLIDDATVDAVNKSTMGKYLQANKNGGYMAPILTGLWATAPYLHNGSVPTLWQLMNPELRPKKFYVGGHKLDFTQVGIAGQTNADGIYVYPQDYQPWSQPVLYDTADPGRGNQGHTFPFAGLSQDDKRKLLEYLKLL